MSNEPTKVDVLERILNCGESMRDVHDAVAELIKAVTAYRKGEYHDPETEFSVDYRERRRKEAARVDAALARAGGDA